MTLRLLLTTSGKHHKLRRRQLAEELARRWRHRNAAYEKIIAE
jgi:hypothetical protein